MYNWIDDRRLSTPKLCPSFGFVPKHPNSFVRSRNGFWSSFNQLPVIKEEEGYTSEEEIELRNFLIPTSSENCQAKKSFNAIRNSPSGVLKSKEPPSREYFQDGKSITKLPPIVNINCLMNLEVKQSQQIWETNFGRRLISGNDIKDELMPSKIKQVSSTRGDVVRKGSGKLGNIQPLLTRRPSEKNSIQERNSKFGGGDRDEGQARGKNEKKKYKKINKETKTPSRKSSNTDKKSIKSTTEIKSIKSNEKYSEPPRKQPSEDSSTISSFTKNQHFLTDCVRSILDSVSQEIRCEHCEEKLTNLEELRDHLKRHEDEKEICLLCDKVFYQPNDFIQHLLSHESVDKFSCKKCRKYFPNLKKYQQHCKEFHLRSSEASMISQHSQLNVEFVKKWLPKYECKRCKVEFDSEEAQKAHKRNHIKMDLTGAYLLSPKTI